MKIICSNCNDSFSNEDDTYEDPRDGENVICGKCLTRLMRSKEMMAKRDQAKKEGQMELAMMVRGAKKRGKSLWKGGSCRIHHFN